MSFTQHFYQKLSFTIDTGTKDCYTNGEMTKKGGMTVLFKTIREQKSQRAKTWQKIADFILTEPAMATTLKLKEFSEHVGVSEGSVVNFARSLGYEGYIELKVGIAQATGKFSDRYGATRGATAFQTIASAAKLSLDESARIINEERLLHLAQLLADTRGRVLVCGRHTSGQIAHVLAGYLMRLGVPAFAAEDARPAAMSLGAGDVMIAITYSGSTESVFEAVDTARERGAHTACITAFESAKIPKICDTCLAFTSVESKEGEFPIVARLVQLAVCDALCAAVGAVKQA